jgi:hypothetical protein
MFGHVAKSQEQKVRYQMIAAGVSTLQRVSESIKIEVLNKSK